MAPILDSEVQNIRYLELSGVYLHSLKSPSLWSFVTAAIGNSDRCYFRRKRQAVLCWKTLKEKVEGGGQIGNFCKNPGETVLSRISARISSVIEEDYKYKNCPWKLTESGDLFDVGELENSLEKENQRQSYRFLAWENRQTGIHLICKARKELRTECDEYPSIYSVWDFSGYSKKTRLVRRWK